MPKWVRRVGALAAAVTTGSLAWTANAQAATPVISMGPAQAVITLPHGCTANDFRVTNWTDGSYHGYIQATCSNKPKLFYIQRYADGRWALRNTNIDMPIVYATTVDSTGTYFVGKRSNHDLVLVRRNNDGSLSGVHVLWSYANDSEAGFVNVEHASVVASSGNYWAIWDENDYSDDFQDHSLAQARTMAPAIKPSATGGDLWYAPILVQRPGESAQLVSCQLSTGVNQENPVPSTIVATQQGTGWSSGQQFDQDGCVLPGGTQPSGVGAYLDGHTYFSTISSNGIYDDRGGAFRLTPLSGTTEPESVLAITGSRVDYVARTTNGTELVWTQNSDGTFNSGPSGALAPAPVPMHQDQIINRSGKLIRLFVQKDSAGHPGTRLLQQVQ